jgi:hypothetical protein
MATRTTVDLLDDIDGKPAAETIGFGIDGVDYEIDVSEKNAKALRKALETWLPVALRVGGRVTRATATRVATGVDNHAVRAWAARNGIELSSRGRIAAHIIDQYRAAGN